MFQPQNEDPWDWMRITDADRFGYDVLDPIEQARWSLVMLLGGAPQIWRAHARHVREIMYSRMDLRKGDRVLLIGEALESCGFVEDIQERISPNGMIDAIDILDETRDAFMNGVRSSSGQFAKWTWHYTQDIPSAAYDAIVCSQAIHHSDDLAQSSRELLRILKPGRWVAIAGMDIGSHLGDAAKASIPVQYLIERLFSRVGWEVADYPYYPLDKLEQVFRSPIADHESFSWKGVDLFWVRKQSSM